MKHLLVLLVLALAASTAGTGAEAPSAEPTRADRMRTERLLLLGEIDRLTAHGATALEVAKLFPRFVRSDPINGEPRVRYRKLTSLMLGEIERLAKRVQELERLHGHQLPETEPLVRITVDRENVPEPPD